MSKVEHTSEKPNTNTSLNKSSTSSVTKSEPSTASNLNANKSKNNLKKPTNHNQNSNNNNNNNNSNSNQGNKPNQSRNDNMRNHNRKYNQNQNYQNNMNNAYFNEPEEKKQEKKFTGRCRLFVGNLPNDITESEFKELFVKFGEMGETFLNAQKSFGFIKLARRMNAEQAKQELDGTLYKGRNLRVKFASHGAAIKIKNLSPFISNEYLEQAFSLFGPVERAIVIVDEKGRSTGEGIVEFERKPSAVQCIAKCTEGCFILTNYPKPVIVEPYEQKDEEDGLPEKAIVKNPQYFQELADAQPRLVLPDSFEFKLASKWKVLHEQERQFNEEVKKRIEQAIENLHYEIEQEIIDHKTMLMKEDLRRRQEELERIEEFRKAELQRRRQQEERFRQEEMLMMRPDQMIMNQHQQGGHYASGAGTNRRFTEQQQYNQQYNTATASNDPSNNSNIVPQTTQNIYPPPVSSATSSAINEPILAVPGEVIDNRKQQTYRRGNKNMNSDQNNSYPGYDRKRQRY